MCSRNAASFIGKIGLLLSFAMVLFMVSDAAAQCYCKTRSSVRRHRVSTARVYHRAPVRTRIVYVDRPVYVNESRPYEAVYSTAVTPVYRSASNSSHVVRTTGLYDEGEIIPDADYHDTARIASDYGYRDGWIDGKDAGMERDAYHPQNSGDFQKATNGYEDTFGSKRVYRLAYRSAYLKGYSHGFRSIANRGWSPRNQ